MSISKKITELLLTYASDIQPCDRQEVINFFDEYTIPYRKDYLDFLVRFGGGDHYPFIFHNLGLSCSFNTIKDIYEEDKNFHEIPSNVCVFANPFFSDYLFIEPEHGGIYREDLDDDDNSCLGEMVWGNIDSFLWDAALGYLDKVSQVILVSENMGSSDLIKFRNEYMDNIVDDIKIPNIEYYFKNNNLYILNLKESKLTVNSLTYGI